MSDAPPSREELSGVIKLKRNAAAPGVDGILYVPYKRCPCLLPILVKLFRKVWETKDVPAEWATATIQLLAKSSKVHDPSEFRPIALTNTIGKIFFSVADSKNTWQGTSTFPMSKRFQGEYPRLS